MDNLLGKSIVATVAAITDLGYRLDYEGEELFLHDNQAPGVYKVDDQIDVFIYTDKSKRIAATAETPIISLGEVAFLEVKDISKNLGVFLDNGIVKDILLSKNDLPKHTKHWPKVGSKMLVRLEATYTNLVAKPVHYNNVAQHMQPSRSLEIKDDVDGYVIFIGQSGLNIASTEGHSIFVHSSNTRGEFHLGQAVSVNVTHVKSRDEYNATMIIDKLASIKEDGKIVFEYMQDNGGRMNFNNKTDARIIKEIFDMSKGAFKNAISNLYKERLIDKDENGWFIK